MSRTMEMIHVASFCRKDAAVVSTSRLDPSRLSITVWVIGVALRVDATHSARSRSTSRSPGCIIS